MARLDTLPKFSELENDRLLIVYNGRFSEDLYCDDVEIITKRRAFKRTEH